MLNLLRKPPPTSADLKAKIAALEAQLPGLQDVVLQCLDDDEGPAFSAAVNEKLVVEQRITAFRQQLPAIEAREAEAAAQAQAAAAAEERLHSIYDDRDPQKPPQKPVHEPIAGDHHEAAQSETPQPAIASAEISGTAEDLPGQGTDNPSYLAELQQNIGELRRLGVQIDAPA